MLTSSAAEIVSESEASDRIRETASGLPWRSRAQDARLVLGMAQQHDISELLASILVGRGVTIDSATAFLNPTLRDSLPDPSHLRDMDKAVERILRALREQQPIAVFGDYDVDGATSTALLSHYFAALGVPILSYIPDRMTEGYGPTIEGFRRIIEGTRVWGLEAGKALSPPTPQPPAPLILTVDCGTMAHAPIAYAKSQGVDVIVIDHHIASAELPDAYAIVNPNRADETSPLTHLAAVGVTFLLLVALNKKLKEGGAGGWGLGAGKADSSSPTPSPQPPAPSFLLSLLDLVALGTVCDVMPLTGLNRAFVAQGLKILNRRQNTGLAALCDTARIAEPPGTYHLGFLLGPRINAGGRVGESGLGVELLTASDALQASTVAAQLDRYNAERQAIENSVLEQALVQAHGQENMPVMLLASEGWHAGVIGIVAGRIKEKYARPVAVISLENGVGKASARSVAGADIGAAVHAAQLAGHIISGGGHAMAAGFSVNQEQLAGLHQFLIARLQGAVAAYGEARTLKLDGWISCAGANLTLLADIQRAGPFGVGNPSPRFAIRAANLVRVDILKEKHLRCILTDATGKRLTAMAFGAVGSRLGQWLQAERRLHLAGELKSNFWQGEESAQFIISDAAKIA